MIRRFIAWVKSLFTAIPAPTVRLSQSDRLTLSAETIAEASRLIVVQAMGKTAWNYDEEVISKVYDDLSRTTNFERLVQLLNSESQRRKRVA